jgi:hypothetical protein
MLLCGSCLALSCVVLSCLLLSCLLLFCLLLSCLGLGLGLVLPEQMSIEPMISFLPTNPNPNPKPSCYCSFLHTLRTMFLRWRSISSDVIVYAQETAWKLWVMSSNTINPYPNFILSLTLTLTLTLRGRKRQWQDKTRLFCRIYVYVFCYIDYLESGWG